MYTLVSTHMTPLEAHIIKGRMEAEGLFVVVYFEYHIWANWFYSHALGGVRLLVPHAVVDAARDITRRIHSGEYEKLLIEDQDISIVSCPKCGSNNTGAHVWLWKLALAFLCTISLPIPYTSHLYSCDDCKHSWIERKQRPYSLFAIAINIVMISFCYFLIFLVLIFIFELLALI